MAGVNGDSAELDKYLNDLGDIPDDNDNNDNDTTDNSGGDNEQRSADNTPANDAAQNKNKDTDTQGQAQGGDQKAGQQPNKGKEGTAQSELKPLGDGSFRDKQGNITDQNGKVIAEGGFAARMYDTNKRLKTQLEERNTQLHNITSRVAEVESLARSIRSQNLDNNEVATALDLAGRMKRGDHLGVAKEVLAAVVAQGYNVTDILGTDVGDTIEMRAMQKMIDDRLEPITRQEKSRQETQQTETRAREAYTRFVSENEHADIHADAIANLARRDGITVQQAYNRIQAFAYQNGLDFTQPLQPQILAAQQQQPTVKQDNSLRTQRPMPNGAATTRMNGAEQQPLAGADDDWGSIIKGVQATLGVH